MDDRPPVIKSLSSAEMQRFLIACAESGGPELSYTDHNKTKLKARMQKAFAGLVSNSGKSPC